MLKLIKTGKKYEFIIEDRESMLLHIKKHYKEWDLETFQLEFDRLAQMKISPEWKEQIHNLIMQTANSSKSIPWRPDFEDDPDRDALRKEYIALADQILMYSILQA